jgi:predicted small metal-binding protein
VIAWPNSVSVGPVERHRDIARCANLMPIPLADVAPERHLVVHESSDVVPTSLIPHMRFLQPHRIAVVGALLLAVSCRNPQADAVIAEQMRDLADELSNAHQETAMMHDQIDSLRTVLARQDTLLRQLAAMANVPVPPR